jgi:hypothetical protein
LSSEKIIDQIRKLLPVAASIEAHGPGDTTAVLAAPADSNKFIATSDAEVSGMWPTWLEILVDCGCRIDYRVAGERLIEGELVGCGHENCEFSWHGAFRCAYGYLEACKTHGD